MALYYVWHNLITPFRNIQHHVHKYTMDYNITEAQINDVHNNSEGYELHL